MAIMTAKPKVSEIWRFEGIESMLPMQPAQPMNTKMAVPIISPRPIIRVSQPVASSCIKLLSPGIAQAVVEVHTGSFSADRAGIGRVRSASLSYGTWGEVYAS